MKLYKIILIFACVLLLTPDAGANTIDISTFYQLLNSVLQNGDTYSFTDDLDSTSTIDRRFYNYDINFEGHNHSIDGNNAYGGFVLGQDNNFNEVIIQNCIGQVDRGSYFAGAIYNSGGHTDIENSAFVSNFSDSGSSSFAVAGAVYNLYGGSMNIQNTDFEKNYTSGALSYGGALSNGYLDNGTAQMSVDSAIFRENHSRGSLYAYGGAVNNEGNITISNTDFENNYVEGVQNSDRDFPFAYGGAIHNKGTMIITDSVFNNNYGGGTSNNITFGGAIANSGSIVINNSLINDSKITSGEQGYGGAIVNNLGATITINDSTIQNSSISNSLNAGKGGAVYNAGTVNLNNTNLKNNYETGSTPNDIFNTSTGIINFLGTGTNNILSGIEGTGNIYKKEGGILNLGGENAAFTGTFNFDEGTVKLLPDSTYFNAANSNFGNNVNFNMQNNQINNINFGNLSLAGTTNIFADVNFADNTMDRINADSLSGSGSLFVAGLNLEGAPTAADIIIPFADDTLKNSVEYTPSTLNTPIYDNSISYDSSSGNFQFLRQGFDSAILASEVATQLAGYLTQIDTYRNIFANLDMVMITPPEIKTKFSMQNKLAMNGTFAYSPFIMPEQGGGIWFKPYSTFESVGLKNGPRVSNVSYGSLVGVESGLTKLNNGWYSIYGVYASYNGSHQAYSGNSIYNNGGLAGLNAVFYKGGFFSAWTANAGASSAEASTRYGRENFAMFSTGIAQMTGYNFEIFERKFIIQPAFLASYTFVNTFNYKTASNVNINTRPLNALQIEPRIKLIGNFKNYVQPYIAVSVVWNIIDKTKFKANDVYLPDLSIDPFVQYGAGIQKRWGDRATGFFETMLRNGGRNGVALLFGIRISI